MKTIDAKSAVDCLPIVRRILHPTDLADTSVRALTVAIKLARQNNAELLLAHALPPPVPIYEIESMQLLISEQIRDRIGDRWSNVLTFYDVPVLATPLDGLPMDVGLWPTAEHVRTYSPNPSKFMRNVRGT